MIQGEGRIYRRGTREYEEEGKRYKNHWLRRGMRKQED
jgi:hypothetical protein